MPELGPYGSVRGARGNSRPYREKHLLALSISQFDPLTDIRAVRPLIEKSAAVSRSSLRREDRLNNIFADGRQIERG